jgi:hypothetical protein
LTTAALLDYLGGVMDKPFPKTPQKIVTITIDENGDQVFLKTDSADVFLEQGEVITRRASHVEPADLKRRILFTVIRALVPDTSKIAAWTRTWACNWRINTSPVGGPTLTWGMVHPKATSGYFHTNRDVIATWGPRTFGNRQDAIDTEIKFLNDFFLERGIA